MRRTPRLVVAACLLVGAPAGGVMAAKLFSLSLDDVARGRAEIVDLTHELTESSPLFPGGVPFSLEPMTRIADGSLSTSRTA